MISHKSLTKIFILPTLFWGGLSAVAQPLKATPSLNITCDVRAGTPEVITTFIDRDRSSHTTMLSFLPEYFSPQAAIDNCRSTAETLQRVYDGREMNYLASDTLDEKPTICVVERRGLGCDSYNSEILFTLKDAVNPTEVLYNMLGNDFKQSKLPDLRTISRIYTDLRPSWWPFK